jgi:hypothetical protein
MFFGLSSAGNQMWHQNSPEILGICESYDYFGISLTNGDFDGDNFADLLLVLHKRILGQMIMQEQLTYCMVLLVVCHQQVIKCGTKIAQAY